MQPYANDPILAKVYTDGWEYGMWSGGSAAGLYEKASPEVIKQAWQSMEDRDESFWEQFEESPLSGEMAGGPQIEGLLENAGMPMDDSLEYYDYREDAANVWMEGYTAGLVDGFEQGLAPLIGQMDQPGNTYLPPEWEHKAGWHGEDDGWGELGQQSHYSLDCPICGSDADYRESRLPGQYLCGNCGAYSSPDSTPMAGTVAPDAEIWDDAGWQDPYNAGWTPPEPDDRNWKFEAAVNPVNYDFIPFTEQELAAFNALPDRERQRWHARAFNLNKRALQQGKEGRVTGRELYALIHRHDNQCAYCDKPLAWAEAGAGRAETPMAQGADEAGTFDHNVPLQLGGTGSVDNLLPTCWHCNREMNQWDRRNHDKNLRQPSRIEENPLIDTEPVYASVGSDAAKQVVAPVILNYPGGWKQLVADLNSLESADGSPESMQGYTRLKTIIGEHFGGDIFQWMTYFNQYAQGLQEAWDLEQQFRMSTNKVQAKCPNCGTLNETEVCTKCGKGLEPEWTKLDQGKDVPWESLPQMGTPQDEFQSWPTDRVPKVNWGQQDNQFGTMISRTAVDDSSNWMVPDVPPADLSGHDGFGNSRLQPGPETNRYLERRFPNLEYTGCPQCGELDMIDTNLGYHCLNCDYWEQGGKERKDTEFLATPEGQAYQQHMDRLRDRADVSEDEFL